MSDVSSLSGRVYILESHYGEMGSNPKSFTQEFGRDMCTTFLVSQLSIPELKNKLLSLVGSILLFISIRSTADATNDSQTNWRNSVKRKSNIHAKVVLSPKLNFSLP